MGMLTDANTKAWQEHAGIKEATGYYRENLRAMSQAAFELIKIIELEISGIRDGDGYWHGSDPQWHTVHDITEAFKRATNEREVSGLDPTTKN
jgi:hypothetical protein